MTLNARGVSNTCDTSSDTTTIMPQFQWSIASVPHFLLPEDYTLATTIHPLAIWQQWHTGVTFNDDIAVGPLKNIPPVNCPQSQLVSVCSVFLHRHWYQPTYRLICTRKVPCFRQHIGVIVCGNHALGPRECSIPNERHVRWLSRVS